MKEFEKQYLEKIKTNIISWYNFKVNSDICIVGNNLEEYVSFLKSKGMNVFDEINNKLYDYIIIFEKLELIEKIKNNLKPNGIILLVLDNKNGIENFAKLEIPEKLVEKITQKYTKLEIENKLKECGYQDYKFYYPLPNYKTANVIFSDEYLPEYNNSKLINNIYYPENTKLLYNENQVLKEITKCGKFTEFTNSYLIEINAKSQEKFIGFNNTRKDEYRLCTKIYKEHVIKEKIYENCNQIESIKNNLNFLENYKINSLDECKENKIYSKFVISKTLSETIVDYILNNNTDKAIETIKEYYNFLKEKFKDNKTDKINKKIFGNLDKINQLYILKSGLIDLVFENVFKINEEYFVFDQEWELENIPLEFILYRAINNLYTYNSQISKYISIEKMYSKFNLEEYILSFKDAENIFQNMVVDKDKISIYELNQFTYVENLENELKVKLDNIKKIEYENENLNIIINNVKHELQNKQSIINYYENMRVVKLMRKFKNK